jgi:hypothetical protein
VCLSTFDFQDSRGPVMCSLQSASEPPMHAEESLPPSGHSADQARSTRACVKEQSKQRLGKLVANCEGLLQIDAGLRRIVALAHGADPESLN